ncbi:16079_t:CDS:2 [Gigaspora margarita]|uniref:16079_t:CDS:1 n=1 Tax=Gigaspora margarita TaxID=4874 RepID=A0ABN7UFU4_GIGMA|nr:16079_t:CDS:2 [Gigaspora margarita]
MSFNNWAELDKWLDNHGLESGFAFTITHKAHIVKERNSSYHTTGCTFCVNAYWHDNNSEVSSDSENEANQNKKKCDICNLRGYNARTCSSMDDYIRNDDNSEFTSDSEKESGQNKRKCDICNLRGHNAQTCSSK